jgi:hypothetical protein
MTVGRLSHFSFFNKFFISIQEEQAFPTLFFSFFRMAVKYSTFKFQRKSSSLAASNWLAVVFLCASEERKQHRSSLVYFFSPSMYSPVGIICFSSCDWILSNIISCLFNFQKIKHRSHLCRKKMFEQLLIRHFSFYSIQGDCLLLRKSFKYSRMRLLSKAHRKIDDW